MGTEKEESRRKSRDLHVRLTEADMETVRRNCQIAGYKSLSRFVRTRLTADMSPRRAPLKDCGGTGIPEWLNLEMEKLTRQVRGVAANYNQSVAVMHNLMMNASSRDTKRHIIRRAARLDALTREMISVLKEIKDMVIAVSPESKEPR